MPTLTLSKRNRLILIATITIILLWVFYTARKALLPFIAGLLIGYVILPLVNFLDKHMVVALRSRKLSRALSILIVYLMIVLVISVIVAFLIPLSFRRKANWVEYGLVGAFFVSLFVEMYGIPLTILFASKYLYQAGMNVPPNVVEFQMFGVGFGMDLAMAYAAVLMTVGTALIIVGWGTLYRNVKSSNLVTNGIYKYSRHPQYLGFLLVIVGWFIGWPTLISLVFVPILVFKYIRVCTTEEREIGQDSDYIKYKEKVPFFV